MKKLKIKRKGFGFELVLEGEVKVDESKIKPYDQYYKDETQKQLTEEIFKYLQEIVPSTKGRKSGDGYYDWNMQIYGSTALKTLAEHLAKNIDTEAE